MPTVLVVGAGASFEVGFPLGSDLLKQLSRTLLIGRESRSGDLIGDHYLAHVVRNYCLEKTGNDRAEAQALLKIIRKAGERIADAASEGMSIDAIIDQHENESVEFIGKLGIVHAILKAEARSPLFVRDAGRVNAAACRDSWLPRLGRLLVESRRLSQIESVFENLTIITFNYDRSIEQYLPSSLVGHYGMPLEEAQGLLQQLRIIHPFGTAGRLSYMPGTSPSVGFGEYEPADLVAVSRQIRTFTEQMEDQEALAAMRNAVQSARRIVFLGFAFHRQNVELISPQSSSRATSVIGTVRGISSLDQTVVFRELKHALGISKNYFSLLDLSCSELFDQNWRSLTE